MSFPWLYYWSRLSHLGPPSKDGSVDTWDSYWAFLWPQPIVLHQWLVPVLCSLLFIPSFPCAPGLSLLSSLREDSAHFSWHALAPNSVSRKWRPSASNFFYCVRDIFPTPRVGEGRRIYSVFLTRGDRETKNSEVVVMIPCQVGTGELLEHPLSLSWGWGL